MTKNKKRVSIGIMIGIVLMLVGCKAPGEDATLGDAFLGEAHENVKAAYGDDYLPSVPIEELYLQEVYGLDMTKVDKVIAEGPMMSVHVDTFIGIKAKSGEAEAIEETLNAYRDDMIKNSMQYPMNIAKVNASKVYRVKDHVFFLMLGATDSGENASEEEALAFAQKQVQIAIDAIEETQK